MLLSSWMLISILCVRKAQKIHWRPRPYTVQDQKATPTKGTEGSAVPLLKHPQRRCPRASLPRETPTYASSPCRSPLLRVTNSLAAQSQQSYIWRCIISKPGAIGKVYVAPFLFVHNIWYVTRGHPQVLKRCLGLVFWFWWGLLVPKVSGSLVWQLIKGWGGELVCSPLHPSQCFDPFLKIQVSQRGMYQRGPAQAIGQTPRRS